MHTPENDRKVISQAWLFRHFPGCAFSTFFHVVHFPFFHFLVVIFCHFPVCAFSTFFMLCIFHVVHFLVVTFLSFSGVCIFYLFPCRAFSILSFSGCAFLSFSSMCIFYLFHVVHFPFFHFPCRAFSVNPVGVGSVGVDGCGWVWKGKNKDWLEPINIKGMHPKL